MVQRHRGPRERELRQPREVVLVVEPPGRFERDGRRRYVGLPTTFSSIGIPLALLAGFHSRGALRVAACVAAGGLALAMVSPFRVPKPGGKWYAILSGGALAVMVVYLLQAARFPAAE